MKKLNTKILNKILKMLDGGVINPKDEATVIAAIKFMEKHNNTLHEDYIQSTEKWFKAIIQRKGAEFIKSADQKNILKNEKTDLQK